MALFSRSTRGRSLIRRALELEGQLRTLGASPTASSREQFASARFALPDLSLEQAVTNR
jgi:hypothetical protein